uniref:Uncharacterized protein n=1 Tax=Arundo donax TaxID=35708 RepID=A0A0A9NY69_ARUDO
MASVARRETLGQNSAFPSWAAKDVSVEQFHPHTIFEDENFDEHSSGSFGIGDEDMDVACSDEGMVDKYYDGDESNTGDEDQPMPLFRRKYLLDTHLRKRDRSSCLNCTPRSGF